MKEINRFIVRYADGSYEIERGVLPHSPRLYYSRDPDGGGRVLLCAMEEPHITLPSPLEGERLYFFLEQEDGSLLTAASRGLEIAGVENFRDLGGYPAADGTAVKWGRFFRGGPLSGLGERERGALAGLRLKRVFDYRTQREQERVPDECPPGAEYVWVPAVPAEKRFQDFANRDMLAHLKTVNTPEAAGDVFTLFKELYAALPFQRNAYEPMLLSLDSGDTLPMYQHCSAGKDRTGVGGALLLLALGVSQEMVVKDYLLSSVFRKEANRRQVDKLVAAGISKAAEELLTRMMTVIDELIWSALNAIRSRYPSYEAFFLGEYGITGERLDSLRKLHTQKMMPA